MLSPAVPRANARTSRSGVIVGVALLILAACVVHILAVNYKADDGYISFKYADNLAKGHGLVYNIGERVEGYTNFLWVMLLAAVRWAAPGVDLLLVSRIAGTAATLLTIVLAFRLATILALDAAVGLLAGAFLAAHASLIAWAGAGLETSLFALLAFAGAVSYIRWLTSGGSLFTTGLWFAAAAMTRPDGVLLFGVTFATTLVLALRSRRVAPAIQLLAGFVIVFVPYYTWRTWYYGDLFPNTAYAKVAGGLTLVSRGLHYVWNYVVQYGVYLWALPVALTLWRRRDAWLGYLSALVATYVAYVVWVGGDGLAFHRFIAHVAPPMYFVAAAALVDLYHRCEPRLSGAVRTAAGSVAVALVLFTTAQVTLVPLLLPARARWTEPQAELSFPGNGRDHSYVWFDNYFVDRLAVAARYLDEHAPPGALVAATPAGSIAYHMHHPVLDMLGLTDKHIARAAEDTSGRYQRSGHEKGDGPYVLSRDPEYILMGNVAVLPFPLDDARMAKKLVLKSEHELWDDPGFHDRYELVSVRLADRGLFQYFTFYRRRHAAAAVNGPQ